MTTKSTVTVNIRKFEYNAERRELSMRAFAMFRETGKAYPEKIVVVGKTRDITFNRQDAHVSKSTGNRLYKMAGGEFELWIEKMNDAERDQLRKIQEF